MIEQLINPFVDGEVITQAKFDVVVNKIKEIINYINEQQPEDIITEASLRYCIAYNSLRIIILFKITDVSNYTFTGTANSYDANNGRVGIHLYDESGYNARKALSSDINNPSSNEEYVALPATLKDSNWLPVDTPYTIVHDSAGRDYGCGVMVSLIPTAKPTLEEILSKFTLQYTNVKPLK